MAVKKHDSGRITPLKKVVALPLLDDLRRMIEYGRGWNERNLAYMVKFAEIFPAETILHALCAKLSWSHFRLLICAGKKQEQIELLELGRSGIHVAEYLTDSLPKDVPQEKLRKAVALARKCLENRGKEGIAKNVTKLLEGE